MSADDDNGMTSSRPYLLRGLHEWIVDNDCTPYLLVDTTQEGVQVPGAYVQDGHIILNISPGAVRDLYMDNDGVSFNARFGGTPMDVVIPIGAVQAIYARENGQGMAFSDTPGGSTPPPETPGPDASKGGRPSLKIVK